MMSVQTREQAVDRLRAGCEQCISSLNELLHIHLEMDPASRAIRPDEEAIVYRLRKVLLHVKAIASWKLDTEVMHVLAPELRAADEQIDLIRKKLPKKELSEYWADEGKTVARERFKSKKEVLSSFIHPSPQRLLLGKELGGLNKPDDVRAYMNMFMSLGNLVYGYAVTLCCLSELQGESKDIPIVPVLTRVSEQFASLSPAECLRFVSREDR